MGRCVSVGILRCCLISAGVVGWWSATAAAQQTVAPTESGSAGPGLVQAPADLGLVIRLSERLFLLRPRTVSRTENVRESIVGVCNVGTAHVSGQLTPDIRPKTDGIAMDLNFRGTSTSQTTARHEGVRIGTTSVTDVEVTTPITFDLESGFQLEPSTSHANLRNVCRRVDAEVHGLRGHIVRNVANRRIRQQEGQIRRESEQATRRRTETDARAEVDQRLQDWNAQWEPLRQLLIAQSWLNENRDVQYASDEEHLLLYIQARAAADDSAESHAPADAPPFPFPPETLPDPVENGLVDVIFYADESQKPALQGILELVESVIDEYAADQPIADRISFATSDGPNWSMLSVSAEPDDDSAAP